MQFDELIKLVREVGHAGLSDFEYREGELYIKMSACPGDQPDSGAASVYESRHRARKRKIYAGQADYTVDTNIPAQPECVTQVQPADITQVQPAHIRQSQPADAAPEHKKTLQEEQKEGEVFEAPVEGVFWFSRLDGTPCPLKPGDEVRVGQVLGRLDCRGRCFEITSTLAGKVVNIYIEDGEEIVAREAMIMVKKP